MERNNKKGSASTTSRSKQPKEVIKARSAPAPAVDTLQDLRLDLNITVDLIPAGSSNRPGVPLTPKQITIHNTDNADPGADAAAHAKYLKGDDARVRQVSWHFTVDDNAVYQTLPIGEVGWHAGTHAGNYSTIGIEICENAGIDQAKANDRAAKLTALMLRELSIDPAGNVVQHNHWSGKDCPQLLRHPPSGWTAFLEKVGSYYVTIASGAQVEHEHRLVPADVGSGVAFANDAHPLVSSVLAGNLELQQAALSLRPPFSRGSAKSEAVGLIQDALDQVLPGLGIQPINAGPDRGIFGLRTEEAVMAFQRADQLVPDGQVGRNTLRALDKMLQSLGAPPPSPSPPVVSTSYDRILQIAADSAIARYYWKDRSTAPLGYTKGMALVFGRVYCKFKAGDLGALEMGRADKDAPLIDALSHYRSKFHEAGMDNSEGGVETLRHLFVLMLGLGMRESSGAYCEGRDTTNPSSGTADTAEAGLFQTSWNAQSASKLMTQLFNDYSRKPEAGFAEVFKEQVHCSDADWRTIGTGTGAQFQDLSKNCPAFAAEFAAVGLRNVRRHWGPINNLAAEIRPEADVMFKAVQGEIDGSNLCPVLL